LLARSMFRTSAAGGVGIVAAPLAQEALELSGRDRHAEELLRRPFFT
jgi:hypothetical protein